MEAILFLLGCSLGALTGYIVFSGIKSLIKR